MAYSGMNVEVVETASEQLRQAAGRLGDIIAASDREVAKLAAVWEGADAQRFVNADWPKH